MAEILTEVLVVEYEEYKPRKGRPQTWIVYIWDTEKVVAEFYTKFALKAFLASPNVVLKG